MIDFSTKLGKRVREQLRSERVVWLTTVSRDGTPQPRPVWFFWDGQSVVIYSEPDTYKVRHIRRNPRVSLHFNTRRRGQRGLCPDRGTPTIPYFSYELPKIQK